MKTAGNILVSVFAVLSCILALYMIVTLFKDFVDPASIGFQYLRLPKVQILVLDAFIIAVMTGLVVWMIIGIIRDSFKTMILASLLIWLVIILEQFIEGFFVNNRV